MRKIVIPKTIGGSDQHISIEKIENYFENAKKAPSIKEQLIVKAYEITKKTKLLYESDEVAVLYSKDETGTYLSCFNKTASAMSLEIPLSAMHLEGAHIAYCVLTAEEISILDDNLVLQVPDGSVLLVKLIKQKEN
ncbi:MAG: hypothetical protein H9872_03335 [Candidatus Cellulosilyticum pullistercoris]|uniref:Uncharacterized protein n=1 Tax=Candidatus Cellulosilyticum pullistercoris TaxID=2838521 RepID=A0A9E2NMV4_9FIRM|nr:hypothetical protein [Candidatus Cellulosilyticum pullistercoris]